jgi:hypothetical protein
VGVAAAGGFLIYLALHWGYYGLPVGERPEHPRHGALRASGQFGLTYAVAGTTLIVLNLGYLIRKRLSRFDWLGELRTWMRFHVLTGLVGPALIVLHTTLVSTSALGGLALSALLVVVVTGIIGRYIYTHVPRSYQGRELELEEVRQRLVQHEQNLRSLGLDPAGLGLDHSPTTATRQSQGVFPALLHLVSGDRAWHRQLREAERRYRRGAQPGAETAAALDLLRRLCRERQWLIRYHELRGLMSSWRFFHRWLAIVLLLTVALHVVLAVRFGNLWMFRR